MMSQRMALLTAALCLLGTGCWNKEPLESRLISDDPVVRQKALKKLHSLSETRKIGVVSVLIQNLKSEDNRTVQRSAQTLAAVGETALPFVAAALRDPDPFVRINATSAIRLIKDPSTRKISSLMQLLNDQHPLVREEAILALGDMGAEAKEALPVLSKSLKDPNNDIRASASKALQKIEGKTPPPT